MSNIAHYLPDLPYLGPAVSRRATVVAATTPQLIKKHVVMASWIKCCWKCFKETNVEY